MKTRHRLVLFVCLLGGLLLMTSAQERGFQRQPAQPTKAFIVGGVRHGATFFPRSNYPEIKPLKEGELDFKHYHTYDEVNFFLKKWAADYPNLVDLYSVGKSYEGREIWQITITNKATGRDVDKPAMFIEGNRHSGEVTAARIGPLVRLACPFELRQGPRPHGDGRQRRPSTSRSRTIRTDRSST